MIPRHSFYLQEPFYPTRKMAPVDKNYVLDSFVFAGIKPFCLPIIIRHCGKSFPSDYLHEKAFLIVLRSYSVIQTHYLGTLHVSR